jgi:transposase
MKLAKIKTDKSDAKMICKFALINQMLLYITLTDV